jgi:hypothetical protein
VSEVVKMLEITGTCEQDPMVFCPGCKCGHLFHVAPSNPTGHRWTWNGDKVKPMFSPSMLVNKDLPGRCHSFVTDGVIQFLPDCDHELRGQSVPLRPFEEDAQW